MAIRLCVASLLVSVNFIGFSFAAFSADYADIPRFGIWETHESCSFKGSFNINICHAGTIVRTSQQTITSEPRRTTEPKIVGVSVPPDSSDGPSWSYETRLWSTEFPLRDANRIGIGYIVEPEPFYRIWSEADFVMHDHMYVSIPRQSRGLYVKSRSKRLFGVANAAPVEVSRSKRQMGSLTRPRFQ